MPSIHVPSPRIAVFALLFILSTHALHAQSGTLSGRVVDAESGQPLSGATVRVLGSEATMRLSGAITGADGSYMVKGLAPGTYRVSITFLSYASFEDSAVVIRGGGTTTVDARLEQSSLELNEVVISASRRPEKITSAPASVSVVDARRIEERPALTPVDHLKSVPGLDIVQSGLTQSNVVARGFNNAGSGTLMMMTDNRIAGVPSLRLNAHNFVPLVNEDIQQIEVIRGPGSALYGPNTANGVLHLITRSPFSSTGTWFSVAGGERKLFQAMGRHAGTVGNNFGYKISAQYMRGEDWGYVDSAEVLARQAFLNDTLNAGVNPDTLKIGLRDSSIERVAGEVRLDYTPVDDLTAILAVGANRAIRNPDITGVGGAQARNWQYTYYQARVLYKELFLQAFLNQSDAGETYLLQTGQPIIDRSTLFVAQAQHSSTLEGIAHFAYGVDYLLTTPVTDSTITGGNEEDDQIMEIGAYLQGEAAIIPNTLELVAAGRIDRHSRLDDLIFSPRAALVYTPSPSHTIRATYNTAYSAPTTNDLFLDIVARKTPIFDVRASGVPESGFTFRRDGDGRVLMRGFPLFGYEAGYEPVGHLAPAWDALRALIRAGGLNLLDSIPPPSGDIVELRTLNSQTGTFDPISQTGAFDPAASVANVEPIRPTINATIELGYKGVIADRLALNIDLYRSQYRDFVGPLRSITPNVFFNRNGLYNHLMTSLHQQGLDTTQYRALAGLLADTASKVPFGVISPEQATDPTAVIFAARNYGDITIYGIDLGWQLGILPVLALNGSISYIDKNFFPNLDGVSDLALNAPKFKYSLGAEYRDPLLGLNAEFRFRHVDGFPVNSGVYIGSVPGYSVVDAVVGYRLPFAEGLNFTISAQNLLTWVEGGSEGVFSQRHAEFVGTPALGRLVVARITYEI